MLWYLPVPDSPAEGALENIAKLPSHPYSPLTGIYSWYPVSSISAPCQMVGLWHLTVQEFTRRLSRPGVSLPPGTLPTYCHGEWLVVSSEAALMVALVEQKWSRSRQFFLKSALPLLWKQYSLISLYQHCYRHLHLCGIPQSLWVKPSSLSFSLKHTH